MKIKVFQLTPNFRIKSVQPYTRHIPSVLDVLELAETTDVIGWLIATSF